MYSIGEFSRINRITTKTLRHYDKIGLLKPHSIDSWTGYRYYSPEQLPTMRLILSLREVGFGLQEIQHIVADQSSLGEYLDRRRREVEVSITVEQRRLVMVERFIAKLEGEEMAEEITIKALPTVTAACMRTVVPGYDTYFDIVPKMGDYMRSVGAVCREPAYCFTIYHDGEYRDTDIDVEICEAVVAPCEESDKVKFRTVEGSDRAACLIHRGPYETLGETYNRLFAAISDENWEAGGPPREEYIDGIWNKDDPADWVTEVQVPLK